MPLRQKRVKWREKILKAPDRRRPIEAAYFRWQKPDKLSDIRMPNRRDGAMAGPSIGVSSAAVASPACVSAVKSRVGMAAGATDEPVSRRPLMYCRAMVNRNAIHSHFGKNEVIAWRRALPCTLALLHKCAAARRSVQ